MLTYKIIIIVAFCNKNEERSGKYSQISVLHFVETRPVGSSVRMFGSRDTKSVAHDTLNTNDGAIMAWSDDHTVVLYLVYFVIFGNNNNLFVLFVAA